MPLADIRLACLARWHVASAAYEINQSQRVGRQFIAPPRDVLVRPNEDEFARIERPRIGFVHVEDGEWNTSACGGVNKA